MAENKKDIELRSEKVRNIVGKIPPVLLRIGISIITLIIILVIIGTYFMPYPEYVQLNLKVYTDTVMVQNSNQYTCGIGYVTGKVKDKIETGQLVEIKIPQTKEKVNGHVSKIYSEPIYIDNYSIYKIEISIPDSLTPYKASNSPYLKGDATIQISDKSVLERFAESVGIKL